MEHAVGTLRSGAAAPSGGCGGFSATGQSREAGQSFPLRPREVVPVFPRPRSAEQAGRRTWRVQP